MINRINMVDESLTLGTLPDYAIVAPKDLVATIKIIPFAVPGNVLAVAEALLRQGGSPLTLYPFRHLKVGLVVTELPGLKDSVTERTIAATEQRVTRLTGTLLPPLRIPARGSTDRQALQSLISQVPTCCWWWAPPRWSTGAMSVPPASSRPAARSCISACRSIPATSSASAASATRPALVLPGCARSPKLNGIDFVLSACSPGCRSARPRSCGWAWVAC